ncbi:hypothetical protein [Agrobacterium pusense]|uniref:hypothetical protein n=1 Tax=Agrobacterium pusense TaxID=648995 RepID=UPI000D1A8E4E|nr:hypothetical protein [Agrobacterium pusense]
MQSERKIHADINQARDGWIQVTLSGDGAADLTEAQIEAALSAAEPVAWYWEDKSGCFHIVMDRPDVQDMAAEFFCEPRPLYAAPTAPSVAVKALQDYVLADFTHLTDAQALSGPYIVKRIKDRFASFALSAQVQDESDIVDCLSAGKPFVFDPATNFCHADDGGAPEHGIKYIPAEQVQDVAGWKLVPIEPTEEMKKAGREEAEDCEDVYGSAIYSTAEIYRAMLPAAPAKQEG